MAASIVHVIKVLCSPKMIDTNALVSEKVSIFSLSYIIVSMTIMDAEVNMMIKISLAISHFSMKLNHHDRKYLN
jgi:hypothetical protein